MIRITALTQECIRRRQSLSQDGHPRDPQVPHEPLGHRQRERQDLLAQRRCLYGDAAVVVEVEHVRVGVQARGMGRVRDDSVDGEDLHGARVGGVLAVPVPFEARVAADRGVGGQV